MYPDDKLIAYYLKCFEKLRRANTYGGAPHKPILLLAILELIERNEIQGNLIEISPELVLTFKSIWSKLVKTPHTANFSLPFYHMKSEPFWKLINKIGVEIPTTSSNSIKSFNALKESIQFAEIDKDLFILCQNPLTRTLLQQSLLNSYFPNTKNEFTSIENEFITQLENQIIHESSSSYKERIEALNRELELKDFEEEIYVRGAVFKREIPKLYNYQCAVSGMRIESLNNSQMIDACHIVPFAISKDDTIHNGISLSPNLHRAFDRGLLTITSEFRVKISSQVSENRSPFSLRQFENKLIHLPQEKKWYPAFENLNWHQENRFLV